MFNIHEFPLGERDEEKLKAYIEGLLSEYAEASEGRQAAESHGDNNWPERFLRYYFDYIDGDLPDLSVADFNEVVFGIIPRKVSTPADAAPEIIAELRHFLSFLARHYGMKEASKIVASLDDRTVLRLKSSLGNPRNFGMAKSYFMQGDKLGFDMSSEEGLAEFTDFYNRNLANTSLGQLEGSLAHGQPPILDKQARDERRKQRKAQRQARKKNRR